MAVPKTAQILRGAPLKVGILLGVSPSSDPTFDVEIARATSSGVYSTVGRLTNLSGGVQATFEDLLPYTTQTFSYKARAVKAGWLAGDYTAVVTARPLPMPEILPKITPLTGKAIGSPLFVSTGTPPQFGSRVGTQKYDKDLAVYPFQFASTANSVAYNANAQYLWPLSTAALAFYTPVLVAPNSTVTDVTFQYRRPSTKGTVRLRVQALAPSTLSATVIDYTATGSGVGIFSKSFTSGFGVGNVYYYCRLDLTSTSGSTTSVSLRSLSFTYGIPSVSVGV